MYDRKLNRYLRRSILFNYDKDYRFGDIYDADWDFDFDNRQVVENFINNRFRNGNYYFYKNWVDNNGRASVAFGLNGIPAPTFAPNQVVGSTSFIANGQNFNSIQVGSTFIPSALPVVNNIRSDFNIISPQIVSGVNYNLNPYYERYPSDDECETAVNEGDCIRIRDYIRYVS